MKQTLLIFVGTTMIAFSGKAQGFGDFLKNVQTKIGSTSTTSSSTNSGTNFTQNEAGQAIKEALTKGITSGVNVLSATNGYYGNNLVKIPFPQQAQIVENTLRQVGAGSLVDNFVLQMNRSAEGAAKQALPIFTQAITNISINDAIALVTSGKQDAATTFLKAATYNSLKAAFKPQIQASLDKTGTPALWKKVTTTYNKVPLVKPVNTDLTDYVTGKALDGLFVMVAQEEAKIRKNPAAQTTSVLQKVFGSLIK